MLLQIAFWLSFILHLVVVFSRLAEHKWYHRIAAAVGVTILTVVYISISYLIYIYYASVPFLRTIWDVITIVAIILIPHHQLYKDLLILIFWLSLVSMFSITMLYM